MLFFQKNEYKYFDKGFQEISLKDLPCAKSSLVFVSKDMRDFKLLFLNSLIKQGKKLRAEKGFHYILRNLKLRSSFGLSHFDIVFYAFIRLRPLVVLRPVKIGRTLYRLPYGLNRKKKNSYAVKFLLKASSISKGTNRFSFDKMIELFLANFLHQENDAFATRLSWHKDAWNNIAFIRFLKGL